MYEKSLLSALPQYQYEYCVWKKSKVQKNSHININKRFYSVPYKYLSEEVDVKITQSKIKVFSNNKLISMHLIENTTIGSFTTNPDHMPKNSNAYWTWDKNRIKVWANKIGVSTSQVIDLIFTHTSVEQQGYHSAISILKLANTYSNERLESACTLALSYTTYPRYKNIKTILQNNQDKIHFNLNIEESTNETSYIRGSQYYKNSGDNNG